MNDICIVDRIFSMSVFIIFSNLNEGLENMMVSQNLFHHFLNQYLLPTHAVNSLEMDEKLDQQFYK